MIQPVILKIGVMNNITKFQPDLIVDEVARASLLQEPNAKKVGHEPAHSDSKHVLKTRSTRFMVTFHFLLLFSFLTSYPRLNPFEDLGRWNGGYGALLGLRIYSMAYLKKKLGLGMPSQIMVMSSWFPLPPLTG